MNDIAQRLKEVRLMYGFTQAQIAEKLKIHRTTYTKYETDHVPDVDTLLKLANIYSMSLDELLCQKAPASDTVKLSSHSRIVLDDLDEQEAVLIRLFRICDNKSAIIELAKKLAYESVIGTFPDENKS